MSSRTSADTIAEEFDEMACECCERYERNGLSNSSSQLLRFLEEGRLNGRTLLDIGCGAGTFSVEALKRGIDATVGIDLSPEMIKTASNLAAASGFENRAKFELGNAATIELPLSDVVVMDKVICCYPEVGPLLTNAARASRVAVGFVVPHDEGLLKVLRLGVYLMNLFQRWRKGTQLYLHPLGLLDGILRDKGFRLARKASSRFWLIFLYKRNEP